MSGGRFVRLGAIDRRRIELFLDGRAIEALEGDSLLVALLANAGTVRDSEFGDGARAGFCLMGACQDCWVWTESGERLRACTTPVAPGLRISTRGPEGGWLRRG
ncbi:MAG: (2Fe-2S)-binding protein [Gammaproteobacteria bacterium]|nr:(2Fe-2S)-binding protein [Gammaproteobacteria bacterium]